MIHFSIYTDIATLRREVSEITLYSVRDKSGWAKGRRDSEIKDGWINGLRNARIRIEDMWQYPTLKEEMHRFLVRIDATYESVTQILVNELGPGAKLKLHRDGAPYRERWHLVIFTNPDVSWFDCIYGTRHMPIGWNGPVPYCGVKHSMTNRSDAVRTHVVIDIDRESLVRR